MCPKRHFERDYNAPKVFFLYNLSLERIKAKHTFIEIHFLKLDHNTTSTGIILLADGKRKCILI